LRLEGDAPSSPSSEGNDDSPAGGGACFPSVRSCSDSSARIRGLCRDCARPQSCYIQFVGLMFEWDELKARENRTKHGISFEEASTVFGDPMALTMDDPLHSAREGREITIGKSAFLRIVVVVHTERRENIRIISARRATAAERGAYEDG
jgi:uncharacterized protein